MIVETRKTAQGTEYWDSKEKRSLFVPTGNKPSFEVATNYDSLVIKSEGNKTIDVKVNTKSKGTRDQGDGTNLEDMTIQQLKDFAKEIDVDVPGNMKKEETIRSHIAEQLTAADE